MHPRKLGSRVTGSFAIDDLGKDPVPEHWTLGEDGLFPQVGFVSSHLVPGDDADLVPRRVKLDLGGTSDHNEGVEEVGLDTAGGEPGVVSLEEDNTDNVVANMSLPLEFLGIAFLIRKQGGYMEHNFYASPVGIDTM